MEYAPRRWAPISLKAMLLLAMGLNLSLELALRGIEWLLDWTCFWPRFWPRLGYVETEAYVSPFPVIPVAHSIAPSQGCVETAWLLPVVFFGIALTIGAAISPTSRFGLLAICAIIALAVGLGFLRTLAVVAFSNSAWPLTHYLRIDFPTAVDTIMYRLEPIGVIAIDLGLLLCGIALGERVTRRQRVVQAEVSPSEWDGNRRQTP